MQENHTLAEQILSRAIQEVVFKYSAYAPIISSFRTAYTDAIPTMGVDKYARLVINPQFLVENEAYACGLLIHETLHIFFGHTTDARSKLAYTEDQAHNKRANIAEDCAINQFIDEPLPPGAVTPATLGEQIGRNLPTQQSAEYYYDQIQAYTADNPACSTDVANTQAMQDELDRMGIEHISQEEVNEKVLDTAKQICEQGNQYGALASFAREMMEPKVDWRPLLQATVRNAEKKVWAESSRSTYKRTRKRSQQVLLPRRYGHKVAATLSFDTSGSISPQMVNQFLAEIRACLRYSEIKECALWHTDNYWYGTPQELEQNIEKVFETGGTSESCMGRAEQHCKADIHFHFSDGYHGTEYGFARPQKNIEIIFNDNEIEEIRRF